MRNTFTKTLEAVRLRKKRLRRQLVIEIISGVVLLACASRNVETGQPWWLLTFSGVLVAMWAVMASRTSRALDVTKADEEKLQTMSDAWDNAVSELKDLGLPQELLDLFNAGPGTTPTEPEKDPAPAADEDTAGPAPTSDDTTPTKP